MALLKISFFKTQKQRVFNYQSRYWNPEKERLEERRRAIAIEQGVPIEEEERDPDQPYKSKIRGQMRRVFEENKRKTRFTKGRSLMTLLLLGLLILAAYFASDLFSLLFTEEANKQQQQQEQVKEKAPKDTHFIIPL